MEFHQVQVDPEILVDRDHRLFRLFQRFLEDLGILSVLDFLVRQ
jgi:hypothetical protein